MVTRFLVVLLCITRLCMAEPLKQPTPIDLAYAELNGYVAIESVEFPDGEGAPYQARMVIRRVVASPSPMRFMLLPGTRIGSPYAAVIAVDRHEWELEAQGDTVRIDVKLYRQSMTHETFSVYGTGPHAAHLKGMVRPLCQTEEMQAASDPQRQAAIWLASCEERPVPGFENAAGLLAGYSRATSGRERRAIVPAPKSISDSDWQLAYVWVQRQLEDGNKSPEAMARAEAVESAENAEPEMMDLLTAIKKSVIRFVLTIPDPENHPFDGAWSFEAGATRREPVRITVPAGSTLGWNPTAAVLLEDLVLDVPPTRGAQRNGAVKIYLQSIPDRGEFDSRWMLMSITEPEPYLVDLLSVPEFLAADDRVRQAAIWVGRARGQRHTRALAYNTYHSTFNTGGNSPRHDCYGITGGHWSEAERLVAIENDGIRERRAVIAAVRAEEDAAESAAIAERNAADARRRQGYEDDKRIAKERRARTVDSTIDRALRLGQITVSIETLSIAPKVTEVVIEPTSKLGTQILEMKIPPGTVVRSKDDPARHGFLPAAVAFVDSDGPVSIPFICTLASLESAGPGNFIIERADPWGMALLPRRMKLNTSELALYPERANARGWDASGVQSQLMTLVRSHPDRTQAEWQREFARHDMPDLFAIMGSVVGFWGDPVNTNTMDGLREQIAWLDDKSAFDEPPLHETALLGRWRVVNAAKGVSVFRQMTEGQRNAPFGAKEGDGWDQRELDRKYDAAIDKLTRFRHESYRFDLMLHEDGTFEATFDAFASDRDHVGRGRWTWDGSALTLDAEDHDYDRPRMLSGVSWHPLWKRRPMRMESGYLVADVHPANERTMAAIWREVQEVPYLNSMARFTAVLLEKVR